MDKAVETMSRRRRFSRSGSGLTLGKRIIFIFAAVFVAACIAAAIFYNQVMNDKQKGYAAGEKTAIREAELAEIAKVERFDSKRSYIIVHGRDEKDNGKIVFVPMAKKEKPVIIDSEAVIAERQIKDDWRKDCESCTFVKISAALIAREPLWEITYKDRSGHFVFSYYSMKDGTASEQFRLSNTID